MSFNDSSQVKAEFRKEGQLKERTNKSGVVDSFGENVLGQGEEKYRLLFDSINEGVAFLKAIYDEGKVVDLAVIDLNPAYESIFGVKKGDRVGRRVSEFFDQATYLEPFCKVASTGEPATFKEYSAYLQKYLRISACIVKKEVLITIFSDITEVKMADEALRESDTRRRSLFTYMLDGYAYCQMIFDDEGKPVDFIYLEVNEAFEKLTGLKKENVTGKRISEIVPEAIGVSPELFETYGRVASTGEAERFEVFFKPLDRWFDISVFSPKKGFFISIFDNITDRKQMQEQLEKYATNLERLVEERTKQLKNAERLAAIGQTAGIVAHDIRDPLQAIINELYLVKSELTSLPESSSAKSIKESLEFVEKSAEYIVKVSWDLQDFTRPLRPRLADIDLCVAMPEAVSAIEIPENVNLSIRCDKQMPTIELDNTFFRRILTNLVINALQAMPQGGTLKLDAYPAEDKVVLTVADTGFGFSEEVKAKLWSPLFTTDVKGQGFGLPVAKRLTESLGGTISFESQLGKGTKFTIRFPITKKSKTA